MKKKVKRGASYNYISSSYLYTNHDYNKYISSSTYLNTNYNK